jgi:hypothetical protein
MITITENAVSHHFSQVEKVANFIFNSLNKQNKTHWKNGFDPIISPLPICLYNSSLEKLNNFRIKKFSELARISMMKWAINEYPFYLLTHIPSVNETLQLQCSGLRPLSMVNDTEFERVKDEHKHFKGPLDFLIHDLIHGYHFFSDPRRRKIQTGLYRFFLACKNTSTFNQFASNLTWNKKADYLFADMNTHPWHLFLTFKSILFEGAKSYFHIPRNQELSPTQNIQIEKLIVDACKEFGAVEDFSSPILSALSIRNASEVYDHDFQEVFAHIADTPFEVDTLHSTH